MREAFGIDQATHTELLSQAREDPVLDEVSATYRATLVTALEDGMITSDEDAMLKTLRAKLGITDNKHATMLAELLDRDD